jgi:hypothetical protein
VPITSTLEWIETTRLSIALREGAFSYPIVGGIHLLAIALFGGMILATDLRLLGWALRRQPVSNVICGLRPWKRLGFTVIVVTGLLLAAAEPVRLYGSPSFWVKIGILALVGVHAAVFRPRVYRCPGRLDAGLSREAKVAAFLSLLLWAGLVLTGRLIAFDESFDYHSTKAGACCLSAECQRPGYLRGR